ncbi:unnamed protein product [Adineta steineri]|uniref:Uncharacterized protein n=1 Tax=Adineta steineri TaxID=433720 RepID=A0A814NXQ5_9BILA|nr:unnamed protein product [Adineta steineri]
MVICAKKWSLEPKKWSFVPKKWSFVPKKWSNLPKKWSFVPKKWSHLPKIWSFVPQKKQFPGRPIWLGVWSGNLKGQEFHKKYNFHKVDERYYQVGKFKRHSFVMRRDSSSS